MTLIKTLILSGQGDHDWKRSTPFVRDLLAGTGRFSVDVTEDPNQVLEHADQLAKYDLLFCDYKGPDWSPQAKRNFEAAIAAGTGLVILHGANNGFVGWVEYEKMAGLLWREGAGHGAYHEFLVTIRDREHPVTAAWPILESGMSSTTAWPISTAFPTRCWLPATLRLTVAAPAATSRSCSLFNTIRDGSFT